MAGYPSTLITMSRTAFTTVELLIVVMAMSILAMMVVPKYMTASNDAKESALLSDLQSLRSQIEIYRAHHLGKGPEYSEAGALDTSNYANRLKGKTDPSGKINPQGKLGPYVDDWPGNPFCSDSVAKSIKFGEALSAPRDGSTGWYVSLTDGSIHPNSTQGALGSSSNSSGAVVTPPPAPPPTGGGTGKRR